jgi:hypothetical protein
VAGWFYRGWWKNPEIAYYVYNKTDLAKTVDAKAGRALF